MLDPMSEIPETDEQAEIALERDSDILTGSLRGIYHTYRAEGETVVEAFRLTLSMHLAVCTEGLDSLVT